MAIMPLTTLLLAHFFSRGEPMTARKCAGLATGFAGVLILVGPGALSQLGGDTVRELAIACGAVFYAINAVLSRRLPPGDPVQRSAAVVLCAAVQLAPIAVYVDFPLGGQTADAWLAALYLGIFPTAAATIIFFHLIDTQGATFVALNNYIIPCLGVVWGVLLLGETITVQSLAALAVILLGVGIATGKRSSAAR